MQRVGLALGLVLLLSGCGDDDAGVGHEGERCG